jgi:hypothetical protein
MAYSIDDYLAEIGWDGTTDKYGRDARQVNYDIQLYGIDGGGFGYDESSVGAYFSNMLPSVTTPPTSNGMDRETGGQIGIETAPPAGNEGVDTSLDPQYPGADPDFWNPQIDPVYPGDPEYVEPDSGTDDRVLVPGGLPPEPTPAPTPAPTPPPISTPPTPDPGTGIVPPPIDDPFVPSAPPEAGNFIDSFLPGSRNDAFYTQQFNQLAQQNQDFQKQQRMAQELRANAPPPQAPDFSWADAYAPPVAQEPTAPSGSTGGTVNTGGNYGGANAYPNYGGTGYVAWPWLGGVDTTGGRLSSTPL